MDAIERFWRQQDQASVNELQREANYWRSREAELLWLVPKAVWRLPVQPWYRRWWRALMRRSR